MYNDIDCNIDINRDGFELNLWNQAVPRFVCKYAMRSEGWAKYHYRMEKKKQCGCYCLNAMERQRHITPFTVGNTGQSILLPEV